MNTAVKVALRVRPLTLQEQINNCSECIAYVPNEPQIGIVGSEKSFTFDHVFDEESSQEKVYNECTKELVEKFVEGFNVTILAYGQTGSGKTYSMGTGMPCQQESDRAIVPRSASAIFEMLDIKAEQDPSMSYEVYVSFLELYNEELIDLLVLPNTRREMIQVREDGFGGITWQGVREHLVQSPQELMDWLVKGSMSRTTASTDMNSTSSRSHAIFSVILKQQCAEEPEASEVPDVDNTDLEDMVPAPRTLNSKNLKKLTSKFHFVDLAGSERLKRTRAVGDRAKEGISINSGLLALGNVISALGDEARKASHVPYRDSKLTRLLQDSLGGNSATLMLACVSGADVDCSETLSTLVYANRARNIRNRVVINQDFRDGSSAEVAQLRAEINRLKMENGAFRAIGAGPTSELNQRRAAEEMRHLRGEVSRLRDRLKESSSELCDVLAERDTLLVEREVTGQDLDFESHPIMTTYHHTVMQLKDRLIAAEDQALELQTLLSNRSLAVFGRRPGSQHHEHSSSYSSHSTNSNNKRRNDPPVDFGHEADAEADEVKQPRQRSISPRSRTSSDAKRYRPQSSRANSHFDFGAALQGREFPPVNRIPPEAAEAASALGEASTWFQSLKKDERQPVGEHDAAALLNIRLPTDYDSADDLMPRPRFNRHGAGVAETLDKAKEDIRRGLLLLKAEKKGMDLELVNFLDPHASMQLRASPTLKRRDSLTSSKSSNSSRSRFNLMDERLSASRIASPISATFPFGAGGGGGAPSVVSGSGSGSGSWKDLHSPKDQLVFMEAEQKAAETVANAMKAMHRFSFPLTADDTQQREMETQQRELEKIQANQEVQRVAQAVLHAPDSPEAVLQTCDDLVKAFEAASADLAESHGERTNSLSGRSHHSGSRHSGSRHSGSIHGGSVHGGSVHGGSVHGGSVHGGSVHGGSVHEGSVHGGSVHSGSLHGASAAGGSVIASSVHSASVPEGSITGSLASSFKRRSTLAPVAEKPNYDLMLSEVQSGIAMKEELVLQLEKAEADYNMLRDQYEEDIRMMQDRIMETEREREREKMQMSKEVNTLPGTAKVKYETKIKQLMNELSELQQKYAEVSKVANEKRNLAENQLRALRVAVETLKAEKQRMIKRMKEDAEKIKEMNAANDREVQALRRSEKAANEGRKKAEREVDLIHQQRVNAAANRNGNGSGLLGAGSNSNHGVIGFLKKPQTPKGITKAPRRPPRLGPVDKTSRETAQNLPVGRYPSSGNQRSVGNPQQYPQQRDSRPTQRGSPRVKVTQKKQVIDRAIYGYISGQHAINVMEDLLQKRQRLSSEKTELVQERERVVLAQEANAHANGDELLDFANEPQYMDDRLAMIDAEVNYINARIRALQAEAAALGFVTTLGANQSGSTSDEEVLMTKLIRQGMSEDAMGLPPGTGATVAFESSLQILRSMDLPETRQFLELLFEDMVAVRTHEYDLEVQVKNQEKATEELKRALEAMRRAAVGATAGYEKRCGGLEQKLRQLGMSTKDLSEDDESTEVLPRTITFEQGALQKSTTNAEGEDEGIASADQDSEGSEGSPRSPVLGNHSNNNSSEDLSTSPGNRWTPLPSNARPRPGSVAESLLDKKALRTSTVFDQLYDEAMKTTASTSPNVGGSGGEFSRAIMSNNERRVSWAGIPPSVGFLGTADQAEHQRLQRSSSTSNISTKEAAPERPALRRPASMYGHQRGDGGNGANTGSQGLGLATTPPTRPRLHRSTSSQGRIQSDQANQGYVSESGHSRHSQQSTQSSTRRNAVASDTLANRRGAATPIPVPTYGPKSSARGHHPHEPSPTGRQPLTVQTGFPQGYQTGANPSQIGRHGRSNSQNHNLPNNMNNGRSSPSPGLVNKRSFHNGSTSTNANGNGRPLSRLGAASMLTTTATATNLVNGIVSPASNSGFQTPSAAEMHFGFNGGQNEQYHQHNHHLTRRQSGSWDDHQSVYERLASVHTQSSQARVMATRHNSFGNGHGGPGSQAGGPTGGSMMTSGNVQSIGFQQLQIHHQQQQQQQLQQQRYQAGGSKPRPIIPSPEGLMMERHQNPENWSSSASSSSVSSAGTTTKNNSNRNSTSSPTLYGVSMQGAAVGGVVESVMLQSSENLHVY